jgi:hypothetical protein
MSAVTIRDQVAFTPHPFPIASLPVFRCIDADDIKGVIIRHKVIRAK